MSCVSSTNSNKDFILENSGFTKMILMESKNTVCEFLLKDKNNTIYEVIEIKKQIENPQNEQTIWIKYIGLRRKSICGAQPIKITEIGK